MIMLKKRILVAEDDLFVLKMVKLRLEHEGYIVLSAADGEEALQEATREQPNLILLDIRMPKLDGYTVCRHLRQQPSTAAIPVIIITASEVHLLRLADRCVEVGANDWIKKPFKTKDLLAKIHRLLDEEEEKSDV